MADTQEMTWQLTEFRSHPGTKPSEPVRAFCRNVVDGDTFDFMAEQRLGVYSYIRVRLVYETGLPFDAPELTSANPLERSLGQDAKTKATQLLLTRPCMIDLRHEAQHQGRILASVKVWTGVVWEDVALWMQKHGYTKLDVPGMVKP